jgi:hypothetical protein
MIPIPVPADDVAFPCPRTDTDFRQDVGVDTLLDLPDYPKSFENGKPFLPDWAITAVPNEMPRMHNWYLKARRLGLRTLCAPYHPKVFRLQGQGIMDVMFNFRDIHNIFRLGELDIEMVRL